jgi:hypothetical protein
MLTTVILVHMLKYSKTGTSWEICALSVKCRGKFRREKDATEKSVKKQEKIPFKIVHQITWKRK